MTKINKKKFLKIVLNIMIIVFMQVIVHYGKIYHKGYEDLKQNMYHNFVDFGTALEDFNDGLSKLLILGHDDVDKEKAFINKSVVSVFHRSNYDAARMGKGRSLYDYDFFYLHVNEVIHNLLADGNITPSEEKYLKNLYAYTEELIKEYNHIVEDVRTNWNFEKIRSLEKRIVSIYNDFSQKADTLLETPKYSFLKTYEGDFQEADFEHAKAYCEEVFSKLVENQSLKYDNKVAINDDQYVFKTYKERDYHKNLFTVKQDMADIEYEVTYHKKTKKITVRAVSYLIPSKKYPENILDNMAKNMVAQLNKNAVNYERKKKYDDDGKLDYIIYSYIEKNNDLYDEMKKIQMHIESHGLISKLEIMDYDAKPISPPTIKEETILSKLDKEAQIIDLFTIRNIEGKTAYVIHIKHGDTLYEAVFDGENGQIQHYGRNIQKNYLNRNF